MKRAFNYTGRHRIPRSALEISVRENDGVPTFDFALHLDRVNVELPEEAGVFVEAYRDRAFRRFEWGTIAAPVAPPDRCLTELGFGTAVLFRVKIVDQASGRGRIVASADRLSPTLEGDVNRESLLPVVYADDMGEVVWRVRLDADSAILELNREIDGIREVALTPSFGSVVYPAVLRQILTHLLIVEQQYEPDDATQAARQWLSFAQELYHEPPPRPDQETYLMPEDWEAVSTWIDGVVDAFCSRLRLAEQYRGAVSVMQES